MIRATLISETILRFTRLGIDSLTSLLLLGFGLLAVLRGSLSLGALTAFYSYADAFADGTQKLQELLHEVYTVRPACARYFSLLDRAPTMQWGEAAAAESATAEVMAATPCQGAIELQSVSISFPGRQKAALRDVSLSIHAGMPFSVSLCLLLFPSVPLRI